MGTLFNSKCLTARLRTILLYLNRGSERLLLQSPDIHLWNFYNIAITIIVCEQECYCCGMALCVCP